MDSVSTSCDVTIYGYSLIIWNTDNFIWRSNFETRNYKLRSILRSI